MRLPSLSLLKELHQLAGGRSGPVGAAWEEVRRGHFVTPPHLLDPATCSDHALRLAVSPLEATKQLQWYSRMGQLVLGSQIGLEEL